MKQNRRILNSQVKTTDFSKSLLILKQIDNTKFSVSMLCIYEA